MNDYTRNEHFRQAIFDKYPQVHPGYVYCADEHPADYVAGVDQLLAAQTLPTGPEWDFPSGSAVEWLNQLIDTEGNTFGLPVSVDLLVAAGLWPEDAVAALRHEVAGQGAGHSLKTFSYLMPSFLLDVREEPWYFPPQPGDFHVGFDDQVVQRIALPIIVGDSPVSLAARVCETYLRPYGRQRCHFDRRDVLSRYQPRCYVSADRLVMFRRGGTFYGVPLCPDCADGLRAEDPAVQFILFNRHPSRR